MQFRKDHEYMDDWSSKIDDYIAEHKKQLAVPKPVSVEDEAKKAVEHANGLGDKERKDFARLSACVGTLVSSCLNLCGSVLSAVYRLFTKHS